MLISEWTCYKKYEVIKLNTIIIPSTYIDSWRLGLVDDLGQDSDRLAFLEKLGHFLLQGQRDHCTIGLLLSILSVDVC